MGMISLRFGKQALFLKLHLFTICRPKKSGQRPMRRD
jgi:hypothetical protein